VRNATDPVFVDHEGGGSIIIRDRRLPGRFGLAAPGSEIPATWRALTRAEFARRVGFDPHRPVHPSRVEARAQRVRDELERIFRSVERNGEAAAA
jgi:hypothetical protein